MVAGVPAVPASPGAVCGVALTTYCPEPGFHGRGRGRRARGARRASLLPREPRPGDLRCARPRHRDEAARRPRDFDAHPHLRRVDEGEDEKAREWLAET